MIEITIFYLHILAWAYAFTKIWQEKGLFSGLLVVLVFVLLFFILWALTSPIAHLIFPESWRSPFFTSDTLSLVLLIPPEVFIFYVYFVKVERKEKS
ncbi:MAG: hypothetical protein N2517_05150 [Ignavibacteria bacterium]|nr:hypothetical protein [Ignavibacteria bacterium]